MTCPCSMTSEVGIVVNMYWYVVGCRMWGVVVGLLISINYLMEFDYVAGEDVILA